LEARLINQATLMLKVKLAEEFTFKVHTAAAAAAAYQP
jgi:hypothetical protein